MVHMVMIMTKPAAVKLVSKCGRVWEVCLTWQEKIWPCEEIAAILGHSPNAWSATCAGSSRAKQVLDAEAQARGRWLVNTAAVVQRFVAEEDDGQG